MVEPEGIGSERPYSAIVEASLLSQPSVDTMHRAAAEFAARFESNASLTFLLAPEREPADFAADWHRAAEGAAMRMMLHTLACELAPRALRVNAIEVTEQTGASRVRPLVHYMAGARAQFLAGQVFDCTAV